MTRECIIARRLLVGVLVFAIGLIAAGCATVRQARAVQRGDARPVGERTATAAEMGLSAASVLTLDRAIQIAIACHPTVAQAQQALAATTAQVAQAGAAYWPALRAGAGSSRRTANSETARNGNDSSDSYSASLGLNMTLYDFGRTTASVRQAVERCIAAVATVGAARSDIAYGVRTAFYDVCQAQELLLVALESVRQFQLHLEQVRVLAEVGNRIRYDVTKAEVDLGNAQLDLINASNAVANARDTLNRSLGLAEEPGYRVAPDRIPEVAGDVQALMRTARERHPAFLVLRAQERMASAGVDAAIADLYPSLKVSGDVSWSWTGSQLPLVWNWLGSLQGALEFFNGGRKTARIEETVAELRAARSRLAEREQQLYQELVRALRERDAARQRMTLTELIRSEAVASLELILERYTLGKASALEVTDAQVTLARVQADQVKARFQYQVALAQIRHSIGDE